MPRIPYRYPAAGTDAIADAIRARRGERGLTPLDGMLLNFPAFADGWNRLLGAVRTGGTLSDDLREIMILRVAAHNRAAFEWIQHEIVARKAGVSTEQLARIGDIRAPLPKTATSLLSTAQLAMLRLADEMTTRVSVSDETFNEVKAALGGEDKKTVEAVSTTATYNMVSRFLVALDVDDRAKEPVPVLGGSVSTPAPSYPLSPSSPAPPVGLVAVPGGVHLATRVHFNSMRSPWLLLINSLMTNLSMWDDVLPSLTSRYNVVTYDQRGHGQSSIPDEPCTLETLADDAAYILASLGVDKAHAVIGVSQGGATALSFAIRHPDLAERIVACDTQAVSPQANVAAWDERIEMARAKGMGALAEVTVPRWFGGKSVASDDVRRRTHDMVASTVVDGFEKGARALQGYDLVQKGLVDKLRTTKVLLVAGSEDGKLPETLKKLAVDVGASGCSFVEIPQAGHLPMCDAPKAWADAVVPWLSQ